MKETLVVDILDSLGPVPLALDPQRFETDDTEDAA